MHWQEIISKKYVPQGFNDFVNIWEVERPRPTRSVWMCHPKTYPRKHHPTTRALNCHSTLVPYLSSHRPRAHDIYRQVYDPALVQPNLEGCLVPMKACVYCGRGRKAESSIVVRFPARSRQQPPVKNVRGCVAERWVWMVFDSHRYLNFSCWGNICIIATSSERLPQWRCSNWKAANAWKWRTWSFKAHHSM